MLSALLGGAFPPRAVARMTAVQQTPSNKIENELEERGTSTGGSTPLWGHASIGVGSLTIEYQESQSDGSYANEIPKTTT